MPYPTGPSRARERIQPLLVVCVLAVLSMVIAVIGATPARVSARELLGDTREPGDVAFIASHRGGGAEAPENTLPAVAGALAGGYEYVEVDVALTADERAVLMHDKSVDRTTDGQGALASLTWEEVRTLDAGSWFSAEYAGTAVPTFDQFLAVLEAYSGRAIVELKGEWSDAAISDAVEAVEARRLDAQVVFASFDARTLASVAASTDVVSRLLILKHMPADIVRATAEADVPGIIVSAAAVRAQPDLVDSLHAAGRRVVVYTLNSDSQWEEMTELGVDGIVTDEPTTLLDWQRAYAGRES
ncbi:glycerophosphodiester phosphodiesterase family protein [Microbacterium sp. NPDC076911]|uniref:glycerophosphodiester phosphodiesterase n=1 Tax=Microbacterium sp. NPDC076911 TaxID=3154958 RepID=UPI0034406570